MAGADLAAAGAAAAMGPTGLALPALESVTGGEAGPSSVESQASLGSTFNIMPSALNLGSIMQPYTDNPYNGGLGLDVPSRWGANSPTASIGQLPGGGGVNWLVVGGVVAVVVLVGAMAYKRRGQHGR